MALWELTPSNLDHPRWEASTYKGRVTVRAPNGDAARQAATQKFYIATGGPIGGLKRRSPWEDHTLLQVTPIENDRYEAEGPTEVLEPAD